MLSLIKRLLTLIAGELNVAYRYKFIPRKRPFIEFRNSNQNLLGSGLSFYIANLTCTNDDDPRVVTHLDSTPANNMTATFRPALNKSRIDLTAIKKSYHEKT